MKGPYRKIHRPTPPKANPGIDHANPIGPEKPIKAVQQYQDPIGPQPPTAGERARGAIGSWLRRGADNFLENMSQPILEPPRDRAPAGRAPRARGGSRGRSGGRQDQGSFAFPPEPTFNPDFLDMAGGGLDMSMHPDPMYHGTGGRRGGRPEGAKEVVVTTRRYKY